MVDINIIASTLDASKNGGGIAQVVKSLSDFSIGNYTTICNVAWNNKEVIIGRYGHQYLNSDINKNSVVHSHGLWDMYGRKTCMLALKNNIPLVISPHGMLEPWALKHKRVKKFIAWHLYQKRIINKASLIIVNSTQEYESVRGLGFKNPIAVLGNGVDETEHCEKITFEKRNNVILFLSRISKVKGITDLIKAWSLVSNKENYQLHLCGNADREYLVEVNRLIKKLNLTSSVKYLGPKFNKEKWQQYESSHLFVLPSYSENFGIVIAEALLAGLPVLTTYATPWAILEERSIGWSTNNDAYELATKIQAYINLPLEDKMSLHERVKKYSQGNFSWEKVFLEYSTCYKWVVNQNLPLPKQIIVE